MSTLLKWGLEGRVNVGFMFIVPSHGAWHRVLYKQTNLCRYQCINLLYIIYNIYLSEFINQKIIIEYPQQ